MNTKAILATLLVIGSSTAALADPMDRDHRDSDDVQAQTVRDHRDDDDAQVQIRRLPPLTVLSQNDKLSTGRSVTRVSSWRKFDKLELQATNGKTDVSRVMVKFSNGRSEVVMENKTIEPGCAGLTIELPSYARISSITVLGHANRRASFEILGA
jgi:hypothetical protein